VALNFADLSPDGGTLRLRVRGSRANGGQERFVSFETDAQCAVLQRYLSVEHRDTQYHDAPLLWTLGRHGTCRRVRITSHALSYWVSQLQRRAGIERRLSPHSFRRAWLAAGIAPG
jgi:site-specific recombinase XerD